MPSMSLLLRREPLATAYQRGIRNLAGLVLVVVRVYVAVIAARTRCEVLPTLHVVLFEADFE